MQNRTDRTHRTIRRGPMPTYDAASPLISLHVPKTGGSSLREVLMAWFQDDLLLHYRDGSLLPDRHALRPGICIHGHFNAARQMGTRDFYPSVAQHIIFLRDPFDRFLSQWFYLNRRHHAGQTIADLADDPTFDVWLHRRAAEQAERRNSYSMIWHLPLPPGAADLDRVFDRHFVFVGIMERYAASMAGLAAALGKPHVPVPHDNATERNADLSQWRPVYERLFTDECAIYHQAVAWNAAATGA